MKDEAILHERVLGGSADPADWQALEELAARDPDLWRRLALGLRDQNELGLAVGAAAATADAVDLPRARHAGSLRRARRAAVGGWAVAALLAFLFVGGLLRGVGGDEALAQPTMEQALDLYRQAGAEEGRLVTELPLVMVDSQPLQGGRGSEVVYLRRLLERRTVKGIYEPGTDEWGQATAVPASTPLRSAEEL